MKTLTWSAFDVSSVLAPREGHSFVYSARLRRWLVYGGVAAKSSTEVFALNPVTGKCSIVETQGNRPSERSYHSTWVDHSGAWMFVFGGKGLSGDLLSDFFALDLSRGIWKKVAFASQPPPRTLQASCAIQGMLFICGGESSHLLSDLWSLPYSEVDWLNIQPQTGGWQQIRSKAQPSPRKGHSFVAYRDSIICFGGATAEGVANDLLIFSLSDMKWAEARGSGPCPSPRAFHSATVLTHTYMSVLGGLDSRNKPLKDFYLLNLNEMTWSCPVTSGPVPSPRYLHGVAWGLSEDGRGLMLVAGGSNRSFCEMQVFTLEEKTAVEAAPVNDLRQGEANLQQLKARIQALESEKASSAIEIEKERQKSTELSNMLAIQAQANEKASQNWKERVEQLSATVTLHKQKDQLMVSRIEDLEDLVKKAEILLITLDHSFNELLSSKKLATAIAAETLETIEERKKAHKESLIHMKSHYQGTTDQLYEIDSRIEAIETSRPFSSIEKSPHHLNDSLDD